MCIMSGSFTFSSTIFHNKFISTRPNRSADRSEDIFSVFTAMCSWFLKLSLCANQSKLYFQGCWSKKKIAYFLPITEWGWQWISVNSCLSTDSHTSLSYWNWNVSRLIATNVYIYIFLFIIHLFLSSPIRSSEPTMWEQLHKTTFFKLSSSLTGLLSQSRDVTATTWRPEM